MAKQETYEVIIFTACELADMHWELEPSSLLGIPAHEPSANVALKPIEMFRQFTVSIIKWVTYLR